MTTSSQTFVYDCMLAHPTQLAILAIPSADGWVLPSVSHASPWIEDATNDIIARFQTLGVEVTLLRSLCSGERQLCEVELRDSTWSVSAPSRWASQDEIMAGARTPEQRAALVGWFAEQATGHVPARRPPWQRGGWFATASDWISHQLVLLGYQPCGMVHQLKGGWEWSSVLRVATDRGDLYFKADSACEPAEPAVIQLLAER